jgi:hypothetical protein
MAKKIAKYTLPRSEEALDTLANSVLTYASPHLDPSTLSTGSGQADSGTKTDGDRGSVAAVAEPWTDIPPASWQAFKDAHAAWVPAYAACKGAHLPWNTEVKNLAETDLRESLTGLLDRGLLLAPRTAADAVAMGFHLIDDTRTVVTKVNDAVDIDEITNGAIPGSHIHVIGYRIEGRPTRAKAPYHLAIFQVYIQGPGDPPPILNSDRDWSKDYVSMNEPFELRHEPGDVGKTAYYRAQWETDGGIKGPWAMSSAEVP